DVAGTEEGLAVDLDEGILRVVRTLPVALKDLGAMADDLAHFVGAFFLQGFHVDHPRIHVEHRNPQALGLGPLVGVDVSGRDGFGQTVAFDVVQAGHLVQFFLDGLGHGRATAANAGEAGEVVLLDVRVGQEVHHHGDDVDPGVDLVALDQLGCHGAVPAGHDDDGGTRVDGAVHGALHARHMEVRQSRQDFRLAVNAVPQHPVQRGGHHRAVGVHAALGYAGGAGAVGNHA